MEIFQWTLAEGFEWILPADPAHCELFFALDGTPQVSWPAPRMEIVHGDAGTRSDFPWFGSCAPVLRASAAGRLRPILEDYGQLLPLDCDESVWLLNVTNVVDALDEQASRIARFDSGEILDIERHVFKADVVCDQLLFKLPTRASATYVGSEFISLLRREGLRGTAFERVWSDAGEGRGSIVLP